jgi:hypothetical protein
MMEINNFNIYKIEHLTLSSTHTYNGTYSSVIPVESRKSINQQPPFKNQWMGEIEH